LYTPLSSPTSATCPALLTLPDFICLIILGMSTYYEGPNCATSSILLFNWRH
jgi:hypothetical protein